MFILRSRISIFGVFNTTLADYQWIFSLSPSKTIVYHRGSICYLFLKSSEKEGGRAERCLLHGRVRARNNYSITFRVSESRSILVNQQSSVSAILQRI